MRDFDDGGRAIGIVDETTTVDVVAAPAETDSLEVNAAEAADDAVVATPGDVHRATPADAAPASNAWLVALAAGIGLIANALLGFALLRRARNAVSVRTTKLATAIEDYNQAVAARAA